MKSSVFVGLVLGLLVSAVGLGTFFYIEQDFAELRTSDTRRPVPAGLPRLLLKKKRRQR